MQIFYEFWVSGRLPGLNEYTAANRGNRYAGAKAKRDAQLIIGRALPVCGLPVVDAPVRVVCVWHEAGRARDPDNIAFAKKFIMDALVARGVLPDDTYKWVRGFRDEFVIPAKISGVKVRLFLA